MTDDMERGLEAGADRIAGRSKDAIRVEAEAIQGEAMARAPVRTGALRSSAAVVEVPGGAAVIFGAPYAAAVEARRPFLRPSLQSARAGLLARLAAIMRGG